MSAVQHWLRIHFKKIFISLLWEIKKAIKTLKKNVMSTTFSQQILSNILLLVITYY